MRHTCGVFGTTAVRQTELEERRKRGRAADEEKISQMVASLLSLYAHRSKRERVRGQSDTHTHTCIHTHSVLQRHRGNAEREREKKRKLRKAVNILFQSFSLSLSRSLQWRTTATLSTADVL